MGSKKRIAIIAHEIQPFSKGYYLRRLAELHWQAAGHDVLVHHGLEDPPDADLAILHIDASVVPAEYRALAERYPRHTNASTPSIERRRFSKILVGREDTYDGPVILKTNGNRHGINDISLARHRVKASLNPLTHLQWRFKRSVTWRLRRLPNDNYTIYENKSDVPTWVWRDRRFIVERFVPQIADASYYVNYWSFIGDRDVVMTCRQPHPIVRPDDGREDLVEVHSDVPEEIRAAREDLGLDFGKFDYLLHEGKPTLIDVTTTPNSGDNAHLPSRLRLIETLAPGLDALLSGSKT